MTASAMTATQAGEFRAAGTDLSERRRSGVSTGPLIDISAAPDTIGMHWGTEGSLRIGAFTTIGHNLITDDGRSEPIQVTAISASYTAPPATSTCAACGTTPGTRFCPRTSCN